MSLIHILSQPGEYFIRLIDLLANANTTTASANATILDHFALTCVDGYQLEHKLHHCVDHIRVGVRIYIRFPSQGLKQS